MKIYPKLFYLFLNWVILNISFGLTNLIIFNTFWVDGWAYPSLFIVLNIIFFIAYFLTGQYKISSRFNNSRILNSNFEFFVIFIFLLLIYWLSINSPKYYKLSFILFITFFIIMKVLLDILTVKYLKKQNKFETIENVVVVNHDEFSLAFVEEIKENKWIGFHVLENNPSLEDIHQFENFLINNQVKNVFINLDIEKLTSHLDNQIRRISENFLIKFYLISEKVGSRLKYSEVEYIGQIPFIQLYKYALDSYYNRTIKRLFDIFFSLFVIIFILSWLFPIIALIIKIQSPGPVFYVNDRLGLDNKPFKCLKFRTMKVRDHNEPFQQTVKNDPRVFKFGKFLRKSNIDEFPQFFNSLIGDISIVGPRPMMLGHMLEYDEEIEEMYSRHLVKPGITGLAQVSGYRGEIDGVKKMRGRIRMDRYYLYNWSFLFDLQIIWWTIKNSFKGDKEAI